VGLHTAISRALEEGRLRGSMARATAQVWCHVAARRVVRSLEVPRGVRVVAVGGATLGGSGKTPLAIACARELASCGARVALVGHAYGARPRRARRVLPDDPLAVVGDEALVAARSLGQQVPVVVAPLRSMALVEAARWADVVVLDGVLQIAPERAALALLAVDASEPWGRAGSVPPCGDLRAPVESLLAAADVVVSVGESPARADARVVSRGAWLDGRLIPWREIRARRVGLVCALGRPDRVLRSLTLRRIEPVVVVRGPDHGAIPAASMKARAADVDLWVATAKCALHVPGAACEHARVATIDHELILSLALRERLRAGLAEARGPGRAP
jgi:tetraacyldisaccharide 4'-kinase